MLILRTMHETRWLNERARAPALGVISAAPLCPHEARMTVLAPVAAPVSCGGQRAPRSPTGAMRFGTAPLTSNASCGPCGGCLSQELELRPRVVEGLRSRLELHRSIVKAWSDTKPWISETEREDVAKLVRSGGTRGM